MTSDFEREIFEQPEVIQLLVRDANGQIRRFVERLQSSPPRFLLIAARGTSDNAATYAKYLFGMFNRTPVGLAMPSLFTLYNRPPRMDDCLVVGISQSGETPDVLSVLVEARKQGVPSVAITNAANSPIALTADYAIYLNAGTERAIPASKSYIAELAAMATISAYWSGDDAMVRDLAGLADQAKQVLSQKTAAHAAARRFAGKNYMVVVGRGINQCTATEIALKIKELSYMVAESYSAADFRHGPIAMLEEGFPAVAVAPQGKTAEDMQQMIEAIRETGAELSVISNVESLLSQCQLPIRLPEDLAEWLSPLIAVIPGQLLALYLSIEKGHDPDRPRRLGKVTFTR